MNGKVVLVVIIGLLFICVGVNYDTITSWFNKEEPEEKEVTESIEVAPINHENFIEDVGRYFFEKEEKKDKVYLIMNVSADTLTFADKPSDINEISKIPESEYKTYNYDPNVKIYYYEVTIKKDGESVIDKYEEVKPLNIDEVPSIVRLREDNAYIEFDNNKITQLLIFNKIEKG